MIVCNDKRIGIFLVPKVGSGTIVNQFKTLNIPTYYCNHIHLNYRSAKEKFKEDIKDFEDYKFYAFYRDPVDRFKSALLYHFKDKKDLTTEEIDYAIEYFYHKILEYINKNPYKEFNIFEDIDKNLVDMKEFVKPQIHWLDFNIEMNLLSYKDFHYNVNRILSLFNVSASNKLPKINGRRFDINFNQYQIDKIKQMYDVDYAFFEKRGINLL